MNPMYCHDFHDLTCKWNEHFHWKFRTVLYCTK